MMNATIHVRFADVNDIPHASDFVLTALNDIGMQNDCVELSK